jgi:DNA-binding CsgD family transcriptional regulator
MIHALLWLNILALLSFVVAVPLIVVTWARSLYSWTKQAMWYLAAMTLYQLLFTFRFFLNIYVESASASLITAITLITALMSAFAVYLLPILVTRYVGKRPGPALYAIAVISALSLLLGSVFINNLSRDLINAINSGYYLYIIFLSAWALVRSRALYFSADARGLRWFFLMHLFFNATFLAYVLSGGFFLDGDIPGVILLVPAYILSWAAIFTGISVRSLFFTPRRKGSAVPDEFIHRFGITPRERQVLEQILRGSSNREIGEQLFISVRTVETHLYHVFDKCGAGTRLELLNMLHNPPVEKD